MSEVQKLLESIADRIRAIRTAKPPVKKREEKKEEGA